MAHDHPAQDGDSLSPVPEPSPVGAALAPSPDANTRRDAALSPGAIDAIARALRAALPGGKIR